MPINEEAMLFNPSLKGLEPQMGIGWRLLSDACWEAFRGLKLNHVVGARTNYGFSARHQLAIDNRKNSAAP
jgi:hypothetical protein